MEHTDLTDKLKTTVWSELEDIERQSHQFCRSQFNLQQVAGPFKVKNHETN